jgi:hypothetical protein
VSVPAEDPPDDQRRERVMSPQTRSALGLPASGAPALRRVVRGRGPGELSALAVSLRVQRRLAVRTMAVLFLAAAGGPLLFAVLGSADSLRVFDIPVTWLVLGALVYPALYVLAKRHADAADRLEDELEQRALGTRTEESPWR